MSEKFERGLETRRAVLGGDYVDQSLSKANAFTRDFQTLVTEYCWDEIWNRPGLPRKTRSIVNLAMLIALNRPNELRLHVRGALTNGVTPDEIKEVFLQSAIYCGIPAALDAFKTAEPIIRESGASDAPPARP